MKKFLAVLLMLAMLLCGAAFAEDTAPALTKDVVVLFTSDVHCGIDQGWGYAGVANMRNSLQVGDEITTIGGLIGKVVSIKDETLVLETSHDRTHIRILKSAVQRVDVKAEDAQD